MRRMYSENQLIALIQQYAQGGDLSVFAPAYNDESTYAKGDIVSKDDKFYQAKANIETAEEWNAEHWNEVTFEEALKPYLNGKYARIISAPNANELTDEDIANLVDGIHIEGTFLGFKNPIIFPSVSNAPNYICGILGEPLSGGIEMRRIQISTTTHKASLESSPIFKMDYQGIVLKGLALVNDKQVPNYPANSGTFTLKCVNGALTWVQDA